MLTESEVRTQKLFVDIMNATSQNKKMWKDSDGIYSYNNNNTYRIEIDRMSAVDSFECHMDMDHAQTLLMKVVTYHFPSLDFKIKNDGTLLVWLIKDPITIDLSNIKEMNEATIRIWEYYL